MMHKQPSVVLKIDQTLFPTPSIITVCHVALLCLSSLCLLVQIFSDVCCAMPSASGQLMGALRAVCLQVNRKAGFQQLVERVNVSCVMYMFIAQTHTTQTQTQTHTTHTHKLHRHTHAHSHST